MNSETLRKIWLKVKEFAYSTLTEENIDKIIKRKEEEIEDVKALEEQEIECVLNELREELEFEGKYDDEEIETAIIKLGEKLNDVGKNTCSK
jgi:hypothetical protein